LSLTQIRPLECLGRQTNLEPAFLLVKLCRGQTSTIHADGVSDVAVPENGSGILEGECEALGRVLRGDGGDVSYVFDLEGMRLAIRHGKSKRPTRPVNMLIQVG
jgi:hypothetical protein